MATEKTFEELKQERESQIVEHFASLRFSGLTVEEASIIVMKKFNIFSRVTVWAIRKRVEKRNAEK